MTHAELGLGLIGIGRPWPAPDRALPSDQQVTDLLGRAVESGIRLFDTAAAYGISEQRLGRFLHGLNPQTRGSLLVATKCGETWTPDRGSVVDHSRAALTTSVARSVDLLGRIDLLQLHQASNDVLDDRSIVTTLQELQGTYDIPHLGASVKDPEACERALGLNLFTHLQMPINHTRPDLVGWAHQHQGAITIIGNRPFASGRALDRAATRLAYTAAAVGPGIVLTGTTNKAHLEATLSAWETL